jgi:phage minor structural protein, N-terminal region
VKMLKLFSANASGVAGSMITTLPDATEALVRREINGEYSLSVTMRPGARFENDIQPGTAIRALVDENGNEQFFVVKRRTRNLTGGLSIYAEHQSYYYNGVLVSGAAAEAEAQANGVFAALRSAAKPAITSLATFTSHRAGTLTANFSAREAPQPLMDALKKWLISAAGGELAFDGYNVDWRDRLGADNGAIYRYGANLTDMTAEDVLDNYASGIYPFWGRYGDANQPLVEIPNKILDFAGTYPITYIIPIDLTDKFDAQPTQAQLLAAAQEYVAVNAPTGIPISIRAERARITGDVPVDLGDTVTVTNTRWQINTKTRVFALTFDALRGKNRDVTFGTVNPGFPGAVKNVR